MADMELRVDDSFKQSLVPVEFNYEELKAWLTESLAKYKGRVFTDEQMPEAKQISATLGKVSKAISDQRIAIKKLYLEPFNDFEVKAKELTAMCDEVRSEIKAQVDAFADSKREAKLALLESFFKANCKGEAADVLTWDGIMDSRWGNATYSQTQAEEEILKAIDLTRGNLEIIREWESGFELELIEEYKKTLDLRAVFAKKRQLDTAKEERDKRKAIVEQTREQKSLFDTAPPVEEPKQTSKVIELHMIAKGTKEQFLALRKAVDQIGMKMERVK